MSNWRNVADFFYYIENLKWLRQFRILDLCLSTFAYISTWTNCKKKVVRHSGNIIYLATIDMLDGCLTEHKVNKFICLKAANELRKTQPIRIILISSDNFVVVFLLKTKASAKKIAKKQKKIKMCPGCFVRIFIRARAKIKRLANWIANEHDLKKKGIYVRVRLLWQHLLVEWPDHFPKNLLATQQTACHFRSSAS